jgi:hypothetical protein
VVDPVATPLTVHVTVPEDPLLNLAWLPLAGVAPVQPKLGVPALWKLHVQMES